MGWFWVGNLIAKGLINETRMHVKHNNNIHNKIIYYEIPTLKDASPPITAAKRH